MTSDVRRLLGMSPSTCGTAYAGDPLPTRGAGAGEWTHRGSIPRLPHVWRHAEAAAPPGFPFGDMRKPRLHPASPLATCGSRGSTRLPDRSALIVGTR